MDNTNRISGIYALIKDKKIIYIGSSLDIKKREAEHEENKDFDDLLFFSTDSPIKYNSRDHIEMLLVEMGVICEILPPLNKIMFTDFFKWFHSIPLNKRDYSRVIKLRDMALAKFEEGTVLWG